MRMKTLVLASSAAAALALSAGAASAEPDGWYGAIDAGYQWIEPINVESEANGANFNIDVNDGWAAFARLGYRFNPNWRVELEGGYRSGDIGTVRAVSGTQGVCSFSPATGPCYSPEGDLESATLMANVIYDFGFEYWGLRPFVGLGAGAIAWAAVPLALGWVANAWWLARRQEETGARTAPAAVPAVLT